jgi:hypothetical protein
MVEVSIPINNMNALYLPLGKVVVVNKKGKTKWVWISANKKYNNLRGWPVIFVKPYMVALRLDRAEVSFKAPILAIEVGPFGDMGLSTPPVPPATQEVVKFVEEEYGGKAIFDNDKDGLKPVLKLKKGDYVFVEGEKFFMDIFINKGDNDTVVMYQKTPETEDMLSCRLAIISFDVGTEVQDFYKKLSGELPCPIK